MKLNKIPSIAYILFFELIISIFICIFFPEFATEYGPLIATMFILFLLIDLSIMPIPEIKKQKEDSLENIDIKMVKNRLKYAFQSFFNSHEINLDYDRPALSQLGVTNFEIELKHNKVKVTVTLFKPSLLIGVQGKQFYELREYLSRMAHRNVRIEIKEPTFFNKEI